MGIDSFFFKFHFYSYNYKCFFFLSRTKVDDLIREVRRRKNGLGGLTMREIVLEAKSILQEKNKIFANVSNIFFLININHFRIELKITSE